MSISDVWKTYPRDEPDDGQFVLGLFDGIPQIFCYDKRFKGNWAIVSASTKSTQSKVLYNTEFTHPDPFLWTEAKGLNMIRYHGDAK